VRRWRPENGLQEVRNKKARASQRYNEWDAKAEVETLQKL
jgi:hypothetical protein